MTSSNGNAKHEPVSQVLSKNAVPLPELKFKTAAVIGAGEIGAPLAARLARYGVSVTLGTLRPETMTKAQKKVRASLEFRAKEVTGVLPLEKKLAKASPEEKSTIEAKLAELQPQMVQLRDQWLARVSFIQNTDQNALIKELGTNWPEIIIESTREDLTTKHAVFTVWASLILQAKKKNPLLELPVIATTTSSLFVTEIGKCLPEELRPRFLNFHPFNPPDRMDLAEVVYTPATSKETIDSVLLFAKSVGLEPVLAKDSCGFIVNRILFAYLGEALRIIERGEASVEEIIESTLNFGYPMDPLRLSDFVGLDVTEAIINNLHDSYKHLEPASVFFKELIAVASNGNKSQKGFYSYLAPTSAGSIVDRAQAASILNLPQTPDCALALERMNVSLSDAERLAALLLKQKAILNPEFVKLVSAHGGRLTGKTPGFDPQRLPLVMANEAARLVEEGVASVADVDLAMDLGTRFPENKGAAIRLGDGLYTISHESSRETLKNLYIKAKTPRLYTSGPFGWLLRLGIEKTVAELKGLERLHGELYSPAALLRDLQWGQIPVAGVNDGKFKKFLYKRAFVKPKGVRGAATEIFEEGIVPTQKKLGAYQLRGRILVSDINANWKWGTRDYPIDLSKYHQETGTIGGSAGLVLITEIGEELVAKGTTKVGDVGIMLTGKHDVITTEALGGSAQAHRSFRIHGYEAKDPFEGSYSQEVVLDWSQFVGIEEGAYAFEDLAGVGLIYPTVQHSWNVLHLKKGDIALVEGAVGGTGAAAVETAKSRNALIIGSVSSEERGRMAKERYGVDSYIDRTKYPTTETYVEHIKEIVRGLTGQKRLLDKVLAYSGQGMFERHMASVREGDPLDTQDYGGQVAYFGAGETGFALEISGTSLDTPLSAMFERISKLRRERYRVPHMRHVLVVAGNSSAETREAIEEAKLRHHSDVIVVVFNDDQEKEIRKWNVLADKGWWHKAKTRDGIVNLSKLNISLAVMPEPPLLPPDHPTEEQRKTHEEKVQAYANYQRNSLIPFGKAIGEIWGKDSGNRPLSPDVAIILRNDTDGEKILNYIMFTGFFTQIAYPNDTSKMRLRWHAALGWMNQNAILLSKKAILGTHYASPAESTSIVDWIMRGRIRPVETKSYWPQEIGVAQELIGTGKNVVLTGLSKKRCKTLNEAYLSQEIIPHLAKLSNPNAAIRESAVADIYDVSLNLAQEALETIKKHGLGHLILTPPTIGLAIEQDRFETIHQAWGQPELAHVPPEHQAREFSLHAGSKHLDILTHTGDGAIKKYLSNYGEGIQQIEFPVADAVLTTSQFQEKGLSTVYTEPRPGANGTLVNFALIESKNRKILIELVELRVGTKAAASSRIVTDLDVKLFAKASGDRNPFHLDDAYAAKTRYGVRIAHGVLTTGICLSKLEEFAPGYKIDSIEVSRFTSAVKIGDTVNPYFEVVEANNKSLLLKISATNQNKEVLFEGQTWISPMSNIGTQALITARAASWGYQWSRDVRAFAVRGAPEFKKGDQAVFKATNSDSQCFNITADTISAFGLLFGADCPNWDKLAGFGPIAHASALYAPGYILAGAQINEYHTPIAAHTTLEARAQISNVEITKSGKTIIKIDITIVDQHQKIVIKGNVTKILAQTKETASSPVSSSSRAG